MLSTEAREELERLIAADELQVGQTFRLMQQGVHALKDIVAHGAAGGEGVASTNRIILRSILDGTVPNSRGISKFTFRVVNRLRRNGPELTSELATYLDELQTRLDERSKSGEMLVEDVNQLLEASEKLAERTEDIKDAVYVYSFPTYLHYGTIEDPDYKWFKIGSTANAVWKRVVDQSRQTSMPEDPVVVRIYYSESLSSMEIERKFHRTLERVGHERSSASRTRAGKEWFATTEDALDAIAELMQLKVITEFDFENHLDTGR